MTYVSQLQAQIASLNATIAECQKKINENNEKKTDIENKMTVVSDKMDYLENEKKNDSFVSSRDSFKWVADNMNNYWVVGDSSSPDYILNDTRTRDQVVNVLYSLNEMVTVDGGVIGGIVSAVMADAKKKIEELEAENLEYTNTIERCQAEIQSLMELLNKSLQQGVDIVEN